MRSKHINVTIDLDRVRASAEAIRARTGVALIAVVKADAYGLGAPRVVDALGAVVDEFAFFTVDEARVLNQPGLVFGPPDADPDDYRKLGLRPTITSLTQAERYAGLPAAINVDTGMQWMGCPAEQLDELLRRSGAREVFTHGGNVSSARALRALAGGRGLRLHAASSALLDCQEAWLDAVRPGLALYRGAVRVTARLAAVRQTRGPVGYSGVESAHIGVFLAGYSNHVPRAPALINGRRQRILEVGMNTSIVSVDPADRVGDEVILLGDELSEETLAGELNVRPHEVLCRYTAMGVRAYRPTP